MCPLRRHLSNELKTNKLKHKSDIKLNTIIQFVKFSNSNLLIFLIIHYGSSYDQEYLFGLRKGRREKSFSKS